MGKIDMQIAIETFPLKSGHRLRGTGSYTRQLIEALEKYEGKHSYYLFTRGQKLPKNIDLVHYPYFDPFFLTLPLLKMTPTVVTVHDLIPIIFEDHFSRGLRGEIKWRIQKLSLMSASAVLTDSLASKEDIACVTGIDEQKIRVVYLSPSESFHPVVDKKTLTRVQKKYDLPEKFILYVGDVNWNKNIHGLLHAFSRVIKIRPQTSLVLVGKQFHNERLSEIVRLNKLIRDLKLMGNIYRPGYVDDNDLPSMYSLASVYTQPSFAEGFGFPVLEAMACGCPVVASNASSLKEIAGPSLLVNPSDTASMSAGIITVLEKTSSEREAIIKNGFDWVKRFSWQKVARETVAVYERVLA